MGYMHAYKFGPWSSACLLVLSLFLAGVGSGIADDARPSIINCDIQSGPCEQSRDGAMITFDIGPRPVRAMQDLTFKVTIDPKASSASFLLMWLNMPAMDMGTNQVVLQMVAPGVYSGRGVIVRCRSGRRTWKATVAVPQLGKLDFIFDILY